jgi:hypothetical protein
MAILSGSTPGLREALATARAAFDEVALAVSEKKAPELAWAEDYAHHWMVMSEPQDASAWLNALADECASDVVAKVQVQGLQNPDGLYALAEGSRALPGNLGWHWQLIKPGDDVVPTWFRQVAIYRPRQGLLWEGPVVERLVHQFNERTPLWDEAHAMDVVVKTDQEQAHPEPDPDQPHYLYRVSQASQDSMYHHSLLLGPAALAEHPGFLEYLATWRGFADQMPARELRRIGEANVNFRLCLHFADELEIPTHQRLSMAHWLARFAWDDEMAVVAVAACLADTGRAKQARRVMHHIQENLENPGRFFLTSHWAWMAETVRDFEGWYMIHDDQRGEDHEGALILETLRRSTIEGHRSMAVPPSYRTGSVATTALEEDAGKH